MASCQYHPVFITFSSWHPYKHLTWHLNQKYNVRHERGQLVLFLIFLIKTESSGLRFHSSCQDWGVVDEMSGGILINSFWNKNSKSINFPTFSYLQYITIIKFVIKYASKVYVWWYKDFYPPTLSKKNNETE